MSSGRSTSRARKAALTVVGIGVSVLFVVLAARKLDTSKIVDALAAADFLPWIPLAALSYLVGHVVRGVRCQRLVSREAELPLPTATNVVVLGYAVNNILPARMGELARAGLLHERTGIPFTQSLTVTLLERILDGWIMLLLFVAAGAVLPESGGVASEAAKVAVAIFGGVSSGILVILLAPHAAAQTAARLAGAVNAEWREPAWRVVMYVSNGLAYLRRPKDAAAIWALSLVVWLFEAGMFLFVLRAFGLEMHPGHALLAMTVTNLAILIPSSPGYIGPFHYFCQQSLILVGVGAAVSLSYAITVHLVFYVPITLWGIAIMLRYGIEIGEMVAISRPGASAPIFEEREGVPICVVGTSRSRGPVPENPSTLMRLVVEGLVPEADPDASEKEHTEQVQASANFVDGQMRALPGRLQVLLAIGLFGFRVLVGLRYLRGFVGMDAATRRRIVQWWAYGRYGLCRQLFRPLRSTALLAWYELPAVRLRLARQNGGPSLRALDGGPAGDDPSPEAKHA